MSDTTAPLDGVVIDETSDTSFATELAKTASINVAATAGTLAGFVLVGLAVDQVQKFRTKRAAKKAAADTTDPTAE